MNRRATVRDKNFWALEAWELLVRPQKAMVGDHVHKKALIYFQYAEIYESHDSHPQAKVRIRPGASIRQKRCAHVALSGQWVCIQQHPATRRCCNRQHLAERVVNVLPPLCFLLHLTGIKPPSEPVCCCGCTIGHGPANRVSGTQSRGYSSR